MASITQCDHMKYWNELEGSKLFNMVFSKNIPIGELELFSINIENDQPKLVFSFDIPELPDSPPTKWGKSFNRCRLGLYCLSIKDLSIKNLPYQGRFFIEIKFLEEIFTVSLSNIKDSSPNIYFKSKYLSLSGPSVYLNESSFQEAYN